MAAYTPAGSQPHPLPAPYPTDPVTPPDTRPPTLTPLHWLALVAFYVGLAVLATYPLVLRLGTGLPADPTERAQDVWQHFWNLWWVRQTLWVEPGNPYTTDALFYPAGASLGLHTLNLPTNALGSLLVPMLGIVPSFNLIVISTLAITGIATFLLARHVSGSNLAALLAGVIVQASPMRLDQVRLSLMATWNDFGLILALLALLITLQRRTRLSIGLAAAAVWLAGLNNWYHLFHTLILFGMLFAWRVVGLLRAAAPTNRRTALLAELRVWLGVGVLAGLLLLPFAIAGAVDALTSPLARKADELVSSADLQRLLPLPQTFGWIWQPVPADWLANYFFALTPLLLAGIGGLLAPRATRMWLVLAAGFLILSLGPTFYWNGQDTGIPLPYAVFRQLPGFEVFRGPARLNAVTTILIALIAAIGLARLLPRLPTPAAVALTAALIALVVAEGVHLPFPLRDATRSPFYAQVAQQAGEWSLVELPFGRADRALQDMYTQAHHGKPILDGHLSRDVQHLPPESIPLLQAIDRAELRPDIVQLPPAQQEQLLHSLRLRYLVLHHSPRYPERTAAQAATARELLGSLTEVYRDSELLVYEIDQVAAWLAQAPDERVAMPLFVGLDEAWTPLEQGAYGLSRWLPATGGTLWLYATTAQRAVLTLTLYSLPPEPRPLAITVNNADDVSGTPTSEIVIPGNQQQTTVQVVLDLPQGASQIKLTAPQGGVSPQALGLGDDPRELSFNVQAISVRGLE